MPQQGGETWPEAATSLQLPARLERAVAQALGRAEVAVLRVCDHGEGLDLVADTKRAAEGGALEPHRAARRRQRLSQSKEDRPGQGLRQRASMRSASKASQRSNVQRIASLEGDVLSLGVRVPGWLVVGQSWGRQAEAVTGNTATVGNAAVLKERRRAVHEHTPEGTGLGGSGGLQRGER